MSGILFSEPPKEWPLDGLEKVSNCPVCRSPRRKLDYEGLIDQFSKCAPGRWSLYCCNDCGSAYLDPRPTPSSISLAYARYYTHKNPGTKIARRWWQLWRIAQRNRYLNEHLGYNVKPAASLQLFVKRSRQGRFRGFVDHLYFPGPGARLLDIGCGNGSFLLRMQSMGWDVCGVEVDANSAQQARASGLDVRMGLLSDANLPEKSFDAVHLSHVIEHLHDPGKILCLCRKLLKPDGQIVIATPNYNAVGRSHFGTYWIGLDPPRHLVLFTNNSLRNLMEKSGFKVSEVLRPPQRAADVFRSHYVRLDEQCAGRPDRLPRHIRKQSDQAAAKADRAARADSDNREEVILHGTKAGE
jgi:2-polyprenyl-3-methyl-5-hydroxy-6-metoxy-1,4-benzoquinol methylase